LNNATGTAAATEIILSTTEVSKHNSQNDCWMIMDNSVYNITPYLPNHPGGIGAILPYCGKDGAAAFASLPHSSFAASLLSNYFVGSLNQKITPQQIQQNVQRTNSVTPPAKTKKERDGEGYDD